MLLELCVPHLFCWLESKQLAHLIRHPYAICGRIQFPGAELCRLSRQSYTLFDLAQGRFLLQQIGDIHARPDIPAEISARSITRYSLIGDLAIFSVVPSQAILH